MADRAMQALVKLALEPEWEAQFEPNSSGYRPGRSTHDAIEAIFNTISLKPKYVYDADIAQCFDRINWAALLGKLKTIQPIARLVQDWLQAGVMDNGQMLFPEAGTPQGGVISPLLANIALHGLERAVTSVSTKNRLTLIRYADDFVILCQDLTTLQTAITVAQTWLGQMGLEIKASKTRLTHTLDPHESNVGFDFLGFTIRQYPVGQHRTRTYRAQPGFKTLIQPSQTAVKRHHHNIRTQIRQHRGAPQRALITTLNPIIRGWTYYYRTCVAKNLFSTLDKQLHTQLRQWAHRRHPHKSTHWQQRHYWSDQNTPTRFSDGKYTLKSYADMSIRRHIKVKGDKSPYDGDWVYWSERMQRDPTKPKQQVKLLKQQQGRCPSCGLRLMTTDVLEVHHRDNDRNNNHYDNLALLHAHCHDQWHGHSTNDNGLPTEEPDQVKISRPVLEWR